MHISPQIETIPDARTYAENASAYAGMPDEESPYVSGPDGQEEPPAAGEFAEFLAGLLRRAGLGEAETGADAEVLDVPLAGMIEAVADELSGEEAAAALAGPGRNKNPWPARPAAGDEPIPAEQSGAIEAELSALDLSEEDQNILLGVELLLGRSAEQPAPEDAAAFSGEIRLAAEGLAGAAADRAALFTGQAENAETPVEIGETAAETGKLAGEHLAAKRAAEDAEDAPQRAGTSVATSELAAGLNAEKLEQAGLRKSGSEKESRGREGPGRLEEARGRRRDRAALEVRDLRTAEGRSLEGGPKTGELPVSADTREPGNAGTREITLELRLPNQGQNAPAAETAWEVKAGQAFENLLSRELHQNFNSDIVRHASMMLRDEGAGTIRLALKPETLGNVKIRLEMAENKITGHIVVESEEALRAFEREVHSLEQAFRESGFEAANLEMSLAGNGGGAEQDWREASSFLPGQMIASQYDAALEGAETPLSAVVDVYQRGPAAINVLA